MGVRFASSMEADGGAKGRHLLKTTLMTCEEEEKRGNIAGVQDLNGLSD